LSISKGSPDTGLTTSWISNNEAAMTNIKNFGELDALEYETLLSLETFVSSYGSDSTLELHINL